jgi:hypothetical protein
MWYGSEGAEGRRLGVFIILIIGDGKFSIVIEICEVQRAY